MDLNRDLDKAEQNILADQKFRARLNALRLGYVYYAFVNWRSLMEIDDHRQTIEILRSVLFEHLNGRLTKAHPSTQTYASPKR